MSDVLGTIGRVVDILDSINARQSCIIRVTNQTDVALRRLEDGHSSGDFVTLPADEIPAGGEDVFASADREGSVLTGCEGFVHYAAGDQGATWTVRWDNPAVSFDGNESSGTLAGTGAERFRSSDRIGGGHAKVDTRFVLRLAGGGGGGGGGGGQQPPSPQPGVDRQATALVTIHNQSTSVLTLVDQGHGHGAFLTFPAVQIEPGESSTFASVETEGAPQEGSQGFVVYAAGAPGTCTLTAVWNNPEGADNTTTVQLDGPEAPLYQVLDQVGQGDENVPVVFTLFGGPGEQPQPQPQPQPQSTFVEPVEQDEPTLRLGDQSVDGWVEYLQQLLNAWGMGPLVVDGDFGGGTHRAVLAFQQGKGLLVDGVVGNQTWAALREEDPRPPSTDGRAPHEFVEPGQEARWATEDHAVGYDAATDVLFLLAHSTGSEPIASGQAIAHIRVSVAGGGEASADIAGDAESGAAAAQGQRLVFRVFGLRAENGPGTYTVDGWLPQDLGGDHTARTIEVP